MYLTLSEIEVPGAGLCYVLDSAGKWPAPECDQLRRPSCCWCTPLRGNSPRGQMKVTAVGCWNVTSSWGQAAASLRSTAASSWNVTSSGARLLLLAALHTGVIPRAALHWREEATLFRPPKSHLVTHNTSSLNYLNCKALLDRLVDRVKPQIATSYFTVRLSACLRQSQNFLLPSGEFTTVFLTNWILKWKDYPAVLGGRYFIFHQTTLHLNSIKTGFKISSKQL